jgi:diacylglycerol kinase family enzyme
MTEFERIVPVVNPHSTNIGRAQGYLDDLYDAFPSFTDRNMQPIETTRNAEKTLERILQNTRPGDLVPILGGDGTISAAAQAAAGRDIILLPMWAGNGNDAASDLNGEAGARPMHQLILHGIKKAIHPVDIHIDSRALQAINYFEVGSNPKGAKLLNTNAWRNLPGYDNDRLRSIYEYAALLPIAFFSRRFPITEDDITRRAVNLSVVRSHHVAKHATFPVSLEETHAFMTESSTPLHLLPWALRALRGTLKGDYLELGQKRSMQIGRTVLYHIDAEPGVIEKGSTLELSMADTPFYAVSTRNYELAA